MSKPGLVDGIFNFFVAWAWPTYWHNWLSMKLFTFGNQLSFFTSDGMALIALRTPSLSFTIENRL